MKMVSVGALMALGVLGGCSQPTTQASVSDAQAAAPAKAAIPTLPPGVLGNEPILAYIKAKMSFTKADEFSKDMDDSPLVGRKFVVSIKYDDTNRGMFSYDADKEIASLYVLPTTRPGENEQDKFDLDHDVTVLDPVKGKTAFGVEMEYRPTIEKNASIGVDPKSLGVFHAMPGSGGGVLDTLEKKFHMAPDDARKAVVGLRMEIEGTVKALDGHAITCFTGVETATLSLAYETHWQDCNLNTHVSRVRIVSPSAGVLGEWSEPTAKTKAKGKAPVTDKPPFEDV